MKSNCEIEKKFLINKLTKIPVIENCECIGGVGNKFRLLIQYNRGVERIIHVTVYESLTPLTIKKVAASIEETEKGYCLMVMAPYISEKSEQVCRDNGIWFADLSGNIMLSVDTLYIYEKGNSNQYPKKKEIGNIFYASSTKTMLILRKLLEDTKRVWKIKDFAMEAGCSIGMVSRVKDKLCEQLWAEMTLEGLKLIDPRGLLDAWSKAYEQTAPKMIPCYTLEALPKFENKIKEMRDAHGIESCLTGLAGGARYVPIIRYNKVHVLVHSEDITEFMKYSNCKQVESGANVILIEARPDQMYGLKNMNGELVASPIQIFLDCMLIKGRGSEMADAIFKKEIQQ